MEIFGNQVAAVGIGETSVGPLPGKTPLQLAAQAVQEALHDSGLTKDKIDGLLCTSSRAQPNYMQSASISEYLQIHPRYSVTMEMGGAVHCAMIKYAAAAIVAGLADTVLIVASDSLLTGMSRSGAVESMAQAGPIHPQFEVPYGPTVPSLFALIAQRHMYEFGTTSEQLASVAVTMRRHASLNPLAHKRDPITVEEVLNSKMICSPLHLLDCSIVSDGGGAIVLTSAERARDLKAKPVFLLGAGEGHTHGYISRAPNLTQFGSAQSGKQAFQTAGLKHSNIDFAQLYDCFTISVIIQLEDLGFCKKGEGGAFVEEGHINLGGRLPVTTHGGLLSHGHPGRVGGMFHVIEAIRQLRGQAGDRQVKNARVGLVHGLGGSMNAHATIIMGG